MAVAGASPASRAAETELRPAFLRILVARSGALLDPLIASTHPADLPVAPTYSENTHLGDRIKRFFPDIYLFTGKTGKSAKPPPTITTVVTNESLMPARVAIPEPAVYAPPSDAKQRHQQ